MKSTIVFLLFVLFLALAGCKKDKKADCQNGLITEAHSVCGVRIIMDNSGDILEPINLSDNLKIDSLTVCLEYEEVDPSEAGVKPAICLLQSHIKVVKITAID